MTEPMILTYEREELAATVAFTVIVSTVDG